MSREYFTNSGFEDHAQAIGHLTITWARLEYSIALALGRLLGISNTRVARVLGVHMSLREQVKTLRVLAFDQRISDDWYKRLDEFLKLVDQGEESLRARRNQFVHDFWSITDSGAEKVRLMSKLMKTESRKDKELVTVDRQIVDAEEIWECAYEVDQATDTIFNLAAEYAGIKMRLPE